jgi:hypothetical protein
MTKTTPPKREAQKNKDNAASPPKDDEAKLTAFAEEFRQIEGEGLEKDIKQGLILREVRKILKDKGEWCDYVTGKLCTNMMRANRLLARARAADIVEFNELLNLTRTAIDILAGEQVPDGALKEAVERRKNGEHITVAVAQKIADTWLAKEGKSRKKPPKKGKQQW